MNLTTRIFKLEAIAATKRKEAAAEQRADEHDVLERLYRLLSNGCITWQDGRWVAGEAVADDARFGPDMDKLAAAMNAGPPFTAAQLCDWWAEQIGGDAWEGRKLAETKARL